MAALFLLIAFEFLVVIIAIIGLRRELDAAQRELPVRPGDMTAAAARAENAVHARQAAISAWAAPSVDKEVRS